jgi:hypothetical protein
MAARSTRIPQNSPITGNPYRALNAPGPFVAANAANPWQAATDPLNNPLPLPGAEVPFVLPGGPNAARPDLAALGLNAAGPQPGAVPAGTPVGTDAWQLAIQNAKLGRGYIENANFVAAKADDFRSNVVVRLREIYARLLSISDQAQILGPAAAAAGGAQAALAELIDEVNRSGMTPQQGQAMADLAEQLNLINIPQMMAGLLREVNSIAGTIGVTLLNRNAADVAPVPLQTGGRREKKAKKTRRKKKKGGYKFTKAAKKRRSLRMSKRKSLSRMHKKTKRKHKRKRKTKKHH